MCGSKMQGKERQHSDIAKSFLRLRGTISPSPKAQSIVQSIVEPGSSCLVPRFVIYFLLLLL